MKRFDLAFPCRADFGAMSIAPGGRFCDDCQKVVHDLSSMSEDEARTLLAETPRERVCVRYVYDAANGEMVFGARAAERSALVPEHRLLARVKGGLALAAAIAAPLLVEACGGNDGNYRERTGDPRVAEETEAVEAEDAGSDATPADEAEEEAVEEAELDSDVPPR